MTIVLQPADVGATTECRHCRQPIVVLESQSKEIRGWRHRRPDGHTIRTCDLPELATVAEPPSTGLSDAGYEAGMKYGLSLPHGHYNRADYPTGYSRDLMLDSQYRDATAAGENDARDIRIARSMRITFERDRADGKLTEGEIVEYEQHFADRSAKLGVKL